MQIKGASFSSFFEYVVLPKGGFIHLRIISDGSIFDYGQLFHHKTLCNAICAKANLLPFGHKHNRQDKQSEK